MKRPIHTYVFTPTSAQLDLSSIAGFDVRNLFAVMDLATGALIYAPTPALGYSAISGSVLTLKAPMVGLSATDPLIVLYDDGGKPAEDTSVQGVVTSLGTDGTGAAVLPGGSTGVRGLLRAIRELLSGNIGVTGTFWQATQPVSVGSLPLPGGAATAAAQPALHADGGSFAHVTNLPATQPISAAALPLPNGAATDATVAAVTTALGLLAKDSTVAKDATLSAIVTALATLAKDSTVAKDSSLTTLHGDLGSILSTLQAQRAETLWTDDTGAFFVRIDKAGVITWTDPSGVSASAPGTGARPAAGTSAIVDASRYVATAGGTGFSAGDYLSHVVTTDPATGVVIGHFWLNVSTETKLAANPASASISPIAPLPTGAATDAKLETIRALLAGTLSISAAALPLPAGAAQDGTDITGSTMPAGGAGIRGWLSAAYGKLSAILTALGTPLQAGGTVNTLVFAPIKGATVRLSVGPTSTTAPVALAANTATSYRVRNPAASASPVAWKLSIVAGGEAAVIPIAYSTAGTGGTVGDKMIDPGGVEIIGLSAVQQTALAAGTLYLSAITPAGGSAEILITPGSGA